MTLMIREMFGVPWESSNYALSSNIMKNISISNPFNCHVCVIRFQIYLSHMKNESDIVFSMATFSNPCFDIRLCSQIRHLYLLQPGEVLGLTPTVALHPQEAHTPLLFFSVHPLKMR